MNEQLLHGLMQLFAILSKIDGVSSQERNAVQAFLQFQLHIEDYDRYMQVFDDFVSAHTRVISKRKNGELIDNSILSVRDSSKMLLICNQINEELTQSQKVVTICTLFSLLGQNTNISAVEYEFLTTAAEIFNIDPHDFALIELICRPYSLSEYENEHLLFIGHFLPAPQSGIEPELLSKRVYIDKFRGCLSICQLPTTNMYLTRYQGPDQISINSQVMSSQGIVRALSPGCVIRNPHSKALYYTDLITHFVSDKQQKLLRFEANCVTYQFSKNKIGLHSFSLLEQAGRLIGIMGPSGAGKSTLMEVLNGNLKPTTGQVLLNGQNIHHARRQTRGAIGYVPQDDLLIEELSVSQNLYYAAKLYFGNYTELMLNQLVDKTLLSLGLSDAAGLRVGNALDKTISGGERKRLNIGLELLRMPEVLFVDEPTSGLSSRDSVTIMDLLKELTLSGKLVFTVIHQPSSEVFKMFDKLIILDTGGYPIYYGNPIEAIVYFKRIISHIKGEQAVCSLCGNVNAEQIFDIIETKTVNQFGRFTNKRRYLPQFWQQNYQNQQSQLPLNIAQSEPTPTPVSLGSSWVRQFGAFISRDVLAKLNNTQYLVINLLQAPVLAFLLAYINKFSKAGQAYTFYENENIPAFIFVSIIVALFMGLTISAEEIFHDRRILRREAFLNLSRSSYLFSKIMVLFGFSAFQTFCFVIVSNYILEIKDFVLWQWLVLFSISCFANMSGLNISSAFKSAVTIYVLIPILLIPQLVLGGIVIPFDKINPYLKGSQPVPFVGEVMASRWAYEALMVSQFTNNQYEQAFYELDKQIAEAEYKKIYLLPALINKTDLVRNELGRMVRLEENRDAVALLIYHLRQEQRLSGLSAGLPINQINAQNISLVQVGQIENYLDRIRQYYIRRFSFYFDAKTKLINLKIGQLGGSGQMLEFKRNYVNEGISMLVQNMATTQRMIETPSKFTQKIYPIYQSPNLENGFLEFRAHFFAPKKHFAGRIFTTFYFNLLIIWAMTGLLYISLYTDLLKKIVNIGKK